MNRKDIEYRYSQLCQFVIQGKLKFALDSQKELIRYSNRSEHFFQLETLTDNYRTLLKYAFQGYTDPQRKEILDNLSASLLQMADEIYAEMMEPYLPYRQQASAGVLRNFGEDPSIQSSKIEELYFSREIAELVKSDTNKSYEICEQVFMLVWLTRRYREPQISLVRKVIHSDDLPWYEKSLVVSALTLSLLDFFDPHKILLLAECVIKHERQVYQRAMTGLVMALVLYDRRLDFYPALREKLSELSLDEGIRSDMELILYQFLMARETEKITREFTEEVLPDMQKMMPKIEDKLQLEDLSAQDDPEGENPVWKEMFDEVPGLFEKIEKFSRMQMEGADVFMSTFSMLKRFDFFNLISNWFIPFYSDNPVIRADEPGYSEMAGRLMESLDKAFYICNSDKYSFALNFQAIPAQQRSMIVTHFEAELAQMKDMADEEQLLDPEIASNTVITQYIQDIYRFYKLFQYKGEFEDIFQWKLKLHELGFFRKWFGRDSFLERVAGFYFNKDHWDEAVMLLRHLEEKGKADAALFEKTAFAYQKMGKFQLAIRYYKKAELFGPEGLWIQKKLGWCYLKLRDYDNAIRYYSDCLEKQPDDLSLHSHLGQCYLNMKDYEKALQHYSKVRFFNPGNIKTLRPIGYCQFALGKSEQAANTYEELFSADPNPTPYDFINAGHVQLSLGNRQQAVEFYQKSIGSKGFDGEQFMIVFDEDIPYLVRNGVPEDDLPLIKDYVLFG